MTFANDLERGTFGEQLFELYCNQQGVECKDTRSNPDYWTVDIDFIVDGVNYEVKTDYWFNTTGNLAVEHQVIYKDGRKCKGWLHTTKADYIVYAIPPKNDSNNQLKGTLWFIKTEELRYITSEHYNKIKICDDGYKQIENYLIKPNTYPYVFYEVEVWEF